KERREDNRLFNERFEKAANQLGSAQYAVRLAGVYALSSLADDWPQGRQTCINVLCANLRQGYAPEPDTDAPLADRLAFIENKEFRHTIIRAIAERLRSPTGKWQGYTFDFTGAVFDGIDFESVTINGGFLNFDQTSFIKARVDFRRMSIMDGTMQFFKAN